MGSPHSKEKNSAETNLLKISRVENKMPKSLFCFCSSRTRLKEYRKFCWKFVFMQECEKLRRVYEWAEIIPIKIEKFKGCDFGMFQKRFSRFQKEFLPSKSKSSYRVGSQIEYELQPISDTQNDKWNCLIRKKVKLEKCTALSREQILTDLIIEALIEPKHESHVCQDFHGMNGEERYVSLCHDFISSGPVGHYRSRIIDSKKNTASPRLRKRSGLTSYNRNKITNSEGDLNLIKLNKQDSENEMHPEEIIDSLIYYKNIAYELEDQINNKENILNYIKSIFTENFVISGENLLSRLKRREISFSKFQEQVEVAYSSLRHFIDVYQEILINFFSLNLLPKSASLVFSKDYLILFTTSVLFTEEIHYILFELQRHLDKMIEERLKVSFQACNNLNPEDFLIPNRVCCTDSTLAYYKNHINSTSDTLPLIKSANSINTNSNTDGDKFYSFLLNKSISNDIPMSSLRRKFTMEKFLSFELDIETGFTMGNQRESNHLFEKSQSFHEAFSEFSKSFAEESHQRGNSRGKANGGECLYNSVHSVESIILTALPETHPFYKAILGFKNIQYVTSPLLKLRCLITTCELVMTCINEFYAKNGLKFTYFVKPEDMVYLFALVIAKSNVQTLNTQFKIIENFSTKNIFESFTGNIFLLFQIALNIVENIPQKHQVNHLI